MGVLLLVSVWFGVCCPDDEDLKARWAPRGAVQLRIPHIVHPEMHVEPPILYELYLDSQ